MSAAGATRRVAERLLPGLGWLRAGRRAGLLVLLAWGLLWWLAVARRARIARTLEGGGPGEWLALATLAAGLAGCWWLGVRGTGSAGGPGIAGRAPDPPGGARGGPRDAGGSAAAETPAHLWRRFRRHRGAAAGLVLLGGLLLSALLTPYLAPHDPTAQDRVVETRFRAPSIDHPMGTDRFGRDVLSRVLYGSRVSLAIGFGAVLIAITLGTLIGAVSGYVGGWVDTVAMRGVDLLLSFPRLVLLIAVVALFEPSITLVILVLGLTGWMGTTRIVRGEVLSIREQEYVQAARALGFGPGRILRRHVLPNALTPVIVAATLGVGNTILAEAALSFLGLGVQPPTPSWGAMVAAGRDVMIDAWWITAFPGLAIVATVMSFNLVGDGFRDVLDPRSEGGRA